MFTFETIIGAICILIAMAGIFLAGLQLGYKICQEDQQKQDDGNDSQSN
jgi:hypothetical protein